MATFASEVVPTCDYHDKADGPPELVHIECLSNCCQVDCFLIVFLFKQVAEDTVETEAMVATGAMVETAVMAAVIEAMVEGREAMVEVTVLTVVVVEVDTPTGVEDTPAVAVDTGITGEGSLTVGMIVHEE